MLYFKSYVFNINNVFISQVLSVSERLEQFQNDSEIFMVSCQLASGKLQLAISNSTWLEETLLQVCPSHVTGPVTWEAVREEVRQESSCFFHVIYINTIIFVNTLEYRNNTICE